MGFSGLSAASAAGNGFQLLRRPGHWQSCGIGAARHKIPSCDRRAVQSAASRLLQIRRICHRNAQRHFAVHAERAVCGASARHFLLHLPEPVVSFGRLPPSRARAEKSAGFLPLCQLFPENDLRPDRRVRTVRAAAEIAAGSSSTAIPSTRSGRITTASGITNGCRS